MFSASIAAAGRGVAELGSCVLGCLDDAELDRAAGRLWAVIERIELGPARAKLVAGTKALHHLLPELVPPMDGEYTLSFFFGHKPFGAEGERFSFTLRPGISFGLEPREDAKSSLAVRRCRRPDRADALEPRRRAARAGTPNGLSRRIVAAIELAHARAARARCIRVYGRGLRNLAR